MDTDGFIITRLQHHQSSFALMLEQKGTFEMKFFEKIAILIRPFILQWMKK
jgi:hypothetical protein